MSAENMSADEGDPIAEIHEIRRRLAAEANYDPHEMGRRLREQQKADTRRIYRTERALVPAKACSSVHEEAEPSCVVREEPPAE